MKQQPRVETVEELKLRVAAIIGGKPEQITRCTTTAPLLVRRNKRATQRKAKRRKDSIGERLFSRFAWCWSVRRTKAAGNAAHPRLSRRAPCVRVLVIISAAEVSVERK